MPIRPKVRKLGSHWFALIERTKSFVETIPSKGISLAAFERAVLLDVDPTAVAAIVDALHGKGVVWAKRNRGEVRLFAAKPKKVAGILGKPEPVEAFLSASVPHVHRLAGALQARELAKSAGNFSAAQDARARVTVCSRRVVTIARGHVSRGLLLADIRRAMWSVFPADAMEALAAFEAAFGVNAADDSFAEDDTSTSGRRIAGNLSLPEKVAALVEKAGVAGITKTTLYQGMRPKPSSIDLAAALDRLSYDRRVDVRRVRVGGSQRQGLRYFSLAAPDETQHASGGRW